MTEADHARITLLHDALRSDDEPVRFNAGLDLVKVKDVAGIPALIEAFDNPSGVVRLFHASRALAELGAHSVPALEQALAWGSVRQRVAAALTLFRIDASRVDRLMPVATDALGGDDDEATGDAIRFLGEAGPAASAAVPRLVERLHTQDEPEDPQAWGVEPRALIASLLAQIGEPRDAIVTALADALHSKIAAVRWGAARALGEMGVAARDAVPTLSALVRDESEVETVRVEAAYALAVAADPVSETVPALLDALGSADYWVRAFAVRIFGEMAAPPRDPVDEAPVDWTTRAFRAVRNVRRLPRLERALIKRIADVLRDPDENVRRNAAWALAQAAERDPSAAEGGLPALMQALGDADTGPVTAESLAKIGDAAIPPLSAALGHDEAPVRRHAAYALGLVATDLSSRAIAAAEEHGGIDHFQPAPAHFYVQAPVTWTEEKLRAFESLAAATRQRGEGSEAVYDLPYPKHEFLRYLVEHQGMLLHGSRHTELEVLKPLRWSTDSSDHGNVSGVYADKDQIRPIYFATLNRSRCFGLNNGFFDLTPEGELSNDADQGFDRRYYRLTIGVNGLRRDPWIPGMVYVLPPETFAHWNEWTSRVPVRPLMKLCVEPRDLPLLDEVWGVDYRQPGSPWVDPRDPFPFLAFVRSTPIRPGRSRH